MGLNRLPERTRWLLHLVVLCCPLVLAALVVTSGHRTVLPHNLYELAKFLALELLTWGLTFTLAFRLSGITSSQLRLRWGHPLRSLGFGVLWFLAIRIAVALLFWICIRWIDPKWIWATEEKMSALMDIPTISHHPIFSIFLFSIVSLFAGFSEELWRAGMFAGLETLFPQIKKSNLGILAILGVISFIFGLGHLYQGGLGVGNALLLGFCLGLVLVYRNSYWEAAIAHTLIDAFAFALVVVLALSSHFLGPMIVYSASQGDLPSVKHFLDMGGDVNATYDSSPDWKNISALEAAADKANPDLVRLLLDRGANPNAFDSRGETPLIAATNLNQLENIKILIARGAALNWRDKKGFTALRAAAEYNRVEAARLLIDAGADIHLSDAKQMTPLAAAQKWRYPEMIQLLQQKEGK